MKTQNTEIRNQNRNPRLKATLEMIRNMKHVGMSRHDARATRRFFRQHRHMLADEAGMTDMELLLAIAVAVLVFVSISLSTNLGTARGELSAIKENDARDEAQRLRFVHQVQTNNFAREAAQETNAVTNGGVQ